MAGQLADWMRLALDGLRRQSWVLLSCPGEDLTPPEELVRQIQKEQQAQSDTARATADDPSAQKDSAEGEEFPVISLHELAKHCTPQDCWIAIHGQVYDVTNWVPRHPGGSIIYKFAGMDCSDQYEAFHARETQKQLRIWQVARLAPLTPRPRPATQAYRRLRQELWEKGYFRFNSGYYLLKHLCLAVIFALACLAVHIQRAASSKASAHDDPSNRSSFAFAPIFWAGLAGLLIALLWHQSAFIAHDSLHNGVLRTRFDLLSLVPPSSPWRGRLRRAAHWWRFKRFLRDPTAESRTDADIGGWEPFNILGLIHGSVIFGISSAKWLAEHSSHHAATLRPLEDPQFNYLPMWLQSIKELGRQALQGSRWDGSRARLQKLTPAWVVDALGVRPAFDHSEQLTPSRTAARADEHKLQDAQGSNPASVPAVATGASPCDGDLPVPPTPGVEAFPDLNLYARLLIRIQHLTLLPLCVVAGRLNFYCECFAYAIRNLVVADFLGMAVFWTWYLTMLLSVHGWAPRLLFFAVSHTAVGALHVQLLISHLATQVFTKAEETQLQFFEFQMRTSRNLRSYWWNHWFHGGLELQIEHHLFPQLPRHNLRSIRPHVQAICEAYGVPYEETGLREGIALCVRNFRQTAQALWDQSLD